MFLFKNTTGQKIAVFAYDTSAGIPKTGDASNITGFISKDGGVSVATNDVNPTELDATNHDGIYIFDLTQAETNTDMFILSAKSSTSNITIEPVIAYTTLLTSARAGYIDTIAGKLPTNYIMGSGVLTDKDDDIDAILEDTAVIGALGVGLTALATQSSVNALGSPMQAGAKVALTDATELQIDTIETETLTHPTLAEIEATTVLAKEANATTNKDTIVAEVNANETKIDTILTETQSHPTLTEIEASTILAKEATLKTKLGIGQFIALK